MSDIEQAAEKLWDENHLTERIAFKQGALWQQSQLLEKEQTQEEEQDYLEEGRKFRAILKEIQTQEQEGKAVGDAEIDDEILIRFLKKHEALKNFAVKFSNYCYLPITDSVEKYFYDWMNTKEGNEYVKEIINAFAVLQSEAEGTTYSEWQLCPKCYGQGIIPNNFLATTTTPFVQCDVCFGAKVLAKNVSENIAAYVHEIDSLRETNRKLGEKIAELQPEAEQSDAEIEKLAQENVSPDYSVEGINIALAVKDGFITGYKASKLKKSDAVEFYDWIKANYYSSYAVCHTLNSTQDLYNKFKESQLKQKQ